MIKYRLGFSFALPIVIGGVVLPISGCAVVFESPIIGIIMLTLGSFFWSSSYGVQIDSDLLKFREYGSMFGINMGNWKSLDKVPYLSIVKGREGMRIHSMSNRSTSSIDDCFEVCLLTKSHRQRVVVQKFDGINEALNFGRKLASKLGKELVQFNPIVSEKTRNRRMNK